MFRLKNDEKRRFMLFGINFSSNEKFKNDKFTL